MSATSFSPQAFARALTHWFATAQRDLPWREQANVNDGYRVLVSEIMLQQTTVAAVIPYYHRFLERFPDVATLAAADIDEVLPLWAGLGYYSRARNLHTAAQVIIERHGGSFPQNYDDVLALPGVGRYTAGAVCSIAFGQKAPIVDANIVRLFARLFCIEGDLKNSKNQARLWGEAQTLVQACEEPAQFNPALMELGALICTPKNPQCDACPVSQFCCAFQTGRQQELPHTTPKKVDKQLHDVCLFIGNQSGVLLRQRTAENTERSWWRGMWELPRTTVQSGETPITAAQRLLDELEIAGEIKHKLKTLKHSVTVHAIRLDCHEIEVSDLYLQSQGDHLRFYEWAMVESLAVPSTMQKLLAWLETHHLKHAQTPLF